MVGALRAVLMGVMGVVGAVRCEPHWQNWGATNSIYSKARATSSHQRGVRAARAVLRVVMGVVGVIGAVRCEPQGQI